MKQWVTKAMMEEKKNSENTVFLKGTISLDFSFLAVPGHYKRLCISAINL